MEDAWLEILEELGPGEVVEAIVFGEWGALNRSDGLPSPVPGHAQGRVLTFDEARPMMSGWSIDSSFGSINCHAMYVWTNHRVGFVGEYDTATTLQWVPRAPRACTPELQ
jgi:hypothetical protein